MRKFNVAIVGATGAVGEELLRVMEDYDFPVANIVPLASANSAGSKIEYIGKEYTVLELTTTAFEENEVDIAFFSAGGSISEKFAKYGLSLPLSSDLKKEEQIYIINSISTYFQNSKK